MVWAIEEIITDVELTGEAIYFEVDGVIVGIDEELNIDVKLIDEPIDEEAGLFDGKVDVGIIEEITTDDIEL